MLGDILTRYFKSKEVIVFQYLFYNMYNNGIIITRMSRIIVKVNKRIIVLKKRVINKIW